MNIPQIPKIFLSVNTLGVPLVYLPVRKMDRMGSLVVFILFLTGAAFVTLIGIYEAFQATRLQGSALIDDKLAFPLGFALILCFVGLLAGYNAYLHWTLGVVVYAGGFVLRDRKGLQVWRWEDIVSTTSAVTRHYILGIYLGTSHIYKVDNIQNQHLVLSDSLSGVEKLALDIDRNTFPLLYGPAAGRYNEGQILDFGPLAISIQGIEIGRNSFPWSDVKGVSIHRGILKISRKGKGFFNSTRITASNIPNVRVLLAIIHQVVGLHVG